MFTLGEKNVNQTCSTIKGSEGLVTSLNGMIEDQSLEVTNSMGLSGCSSKKSWSDQTVFTKKRFDIKYPLTEPMTYKRFVKSLK